MKLDSMNDLYDLIIEYMEFYETRYTKMSGTQKKINVTNFIENMIKNRVDDVAKREFYMSMVEPTIELVIFVSKRRKLLLNVKDKLIKTCFSCIKS